MYVQIVSPPWHFSVVRCIASHVHRDRAVTAELADSDASWVQSFWCATTTHQPDMAMVGVKGDINGGNFPPSQLEQRSHFGLWCVLSSPLTLSLNLADKQAVDAAWPIITNGISATPYITLLCLLIAMFLSQLSFSWIPCLIDSRRE